MKINFDAHIHPAQRRCLGIVLRDDEGKVILTGTRYVQASWSVEVTEAAAALYGLEVAHRSGYNHIHLEGDAISVINAISKQQQGLSPIHLIYDNISIVRSLFSSFTCTHVRRCGNTVAHLVARLDTDSHEEKICMHPIPKSIQTLADLDLI